METVVKSLILDRISDRREILRLLREYTGGAAVEVIELIPQGETKTTLHFRRLMNLATRDFSLRELAVSLTPYTALYLVTESDEVLNAEDSIAVSLFPSFNSDAEHGLCIDLEAPEGSQFTFEVYENTDGFADRLAIDILCPRVGDGRRLTQLIQTFFTAFPHGATEKLCLAFKDWTVSTPSQNSRIGMNFRTWNVRMRNVGGDAVLSFSHENRGVVQAVVSGLLISDSALLDYQREQVKRVKETLEEKVCELLAQK